MVFGQDKRFAARGQGVSISLFDRFGSDPLGKPQVFFPDRNINAGGQPHQIERVRRRPCFIQIVHAPDEASFFIPPRPEVFDMQIAHTQYWRGLHQIGAKLRPELQPAIEGGAEKRECGFRHVLMLKREILANDRQLPCQPMFERISAIHRPICSISGSRMPRVVTEGLPRRIPPPFMGGRGSNGIEFLFTVMPARSRAFSASVPVMPRECTSIRNRWLSVPPVTMRNPSLATAAAMAFVLATTCLWYSLKDGSMASFKQTAFAAMVCTSGPPCVPGNVSLSSSLANAALHRTKPPRGPRSVL